MEPIGYRKYEAAQKQVKRIKSFYRHSIVFSIIMMALFITRYVIFPAIGFYYEDTGFKNWLDWNTYGLGVVWLIAIGIQALFVFKPKKIRKWEEHKIQELMEKENELHHDRWN